MQAKAYGGVRQRQAERERHIKPMAAGESDMTAGGQNGLHSQ